MCWRDKNRNETTSAAWWFLTFNLPSSVRDRLNPEFLFSDLMALMAPDLMSILACSVAVAVSTTGWSDKASEKQSTTRHSNQGKEMRCDINHKVTFAHCDYDFRTDSCSGSFYSQEWKSDSLRLSPVWLVWLLELCFLSASRAFFCRERKHSKVFFVVCLFCAFICLSKTA